MQSVKLLLGSTEVAGKMIVGIFFTVILTILQLHVPTLRPVNMGKIVFDVNMLKVLIAFVQFKCLLRTRFEIAFACACNAAYHLPRLLIFLCFFDVSFLLMLA